MKRKKFSIYLFMCTSLIFLFKNPSITNSDIISCRRIKGSLTYYRDFATFGLKLLQDLYSKLDIKDIPKLSSIKFLVEIGKLKEAEAIIHAWRSEVGKGEYFSFDNYIIGVKKVAEAYANQGNMEKANEVLEDLLSLLFGPHEYKINYSMGNLLGIYETYYYRLNNPDKAIEVLDKVYEIVEGIEDPYAYVRYSLSIVLAYAAMNTIDKAEEVLEDIRERISSEKARVRDYGLKKICETYATIIGDLEKAYQIAQEIPGIEVRTQVIISIAELFADTQKYDNPERSKQILDELLSLIDRMSSLSGPLANLVFQRCKAEICGAYARIGCLGLAKQIAEELSPMFKTFAYIFIGKGLIERGVFEEAKLFLDAASENISNIPDEITRNQWLYTLSHMWIKAEELNRAYFEAQRIDDIALKSKALLGIVESYAEKGEIDKANEIVSEIETETWRKYAYIAIAKAYVEQGEIDKALELADLASEIYHYVIEWYIAEGELEQASQLILELESPASRREYAIKIALAYIEKGDIEKALETYLSSDPYSVWQITEDLAIIYANTNKESLRDEFISLYKTNPLTPDQKISMGIFLKKGEINSIAEDNYDKALLYYGYCLFLPYIDSEILDWARILSESGSEEEKEIAEKLIDLILSKEP